MAQDPSPIDCPLCFSTRAVILSEKGRHGSPLQSCCCLGCGLIYNNPIPNEQELRDFCKDKYRLNYKKRRKSKRKHHVRYSGRAANQITANPEIYKKAKTMLDIGSGSGEALALLNQMGLEVEGIEPTKDYATYVSKTFGVPVFNGSVDDFKTDKKFSLIRLNHVLEHMRDPVEKLTTIRNLLSRGGVLHVEVPDIRTYFQVKSPGRVFHYGHIYNFSNETLLMSAARAGLKEVARFGPTSIYFKRCKPFKIKANPDLAAELISMNALYQVGVYHSRSESALKLLRKMTNRMLEEVHVRRLQSPTAIIGHFADKVKTSLAKS